MVRPIGEITWVKPWFAVSPTWSTTSQTGITEVSLPVWSEEEEKKEIYTYE